MSASTAPPLPPVSPAEMQTLVSRAGLSLNPGQMADLVLAWRQVAGLLALIPRDRPMTDDQAYVFRLSPPAATVGVSPASKPAAKAPPARKAATKPAPKATPVRKAAKPTARQAARKLARSQVAKQPTKKPASRKPARRRR
jgi:hypothetical protein